MKLFLLLCFCSRILYSNATNSTTNDKIQCPCPQGIDDECTTQEICVYGINDGGDIFHNGKNDVMDLTNVAKKRRAEIGYKNYDDDDDVIVNLYNPFNKSMAIFYYGCRRCEDLLNFDRNITVFKLRIFLLSLYNQRMKYNIKYSQSDFVYYNDTVNEQQAMPEINVRPFWKHRLMLNQTCAHKKQGFTQKHFIPAFLTQELCVLDFKFIQYIKDGKITESYDTDNGEITYSLTLSNDDLYKYNIIGNSTLELPTAYQEKQEICKFSFYLDTNQRSMRFFCLCNTHICTTKVTQKDTTQYCPYEMKVKIDSGFTYTSLMYTSSYMGVDEFFFKAEDNDTMVCAFVWRTYDTKYEIFIRKRDPLPVGYTFIPSFNNPKHFCIFNYYMNYEIAPVQARFYSPSTAALRNAVLNAILDHSQLLNDKMLVGAKCLAEGGLSDSFLSSSYGSNTSSFPCYHYIDIYSKKPIFPMIGVNAMPVTVIKGKDCYYYTIKIAGKITELCGFTDGEPIMVMVGCPNDMEFDKEEITRIQNILGACPTMKPGESQWEYKPTLEIRLVICGQFLRGLKLIDGKYVPEEVELREINVDDLEMTGMWDEEKKTYVYHGCGFDPSQNLTLCTCYAALGGCDDLYTVGRVHLLRYLPFDDSHA